MQKYEAVIMVFIALQAVKTDEVDLVCVWDF